jgi:hydrogenase maturation factor
LSFANNTLHATVSGDFNDNLALANVTIAGTTGASHGMSIMCGKQESQWYSASCVKRGEAKKGVHSRFKNGVLYVTGLEDATKGGVWSGDLEIKLD